MENKLLHIYGQEQWHDDIYIKGNRVALKTLADTIYALLKSGKTCIVDEPYFTNDGEGYGIQIEIKNEKEFDKIELPYTADYARKDK